MTATIASILAAAALIWGPWAQVNPGTGRIQAIDARHAPVVELHHLRTQARHSLRLFDDQGRLRADALAQLRAFLTDPRSKIDHPFHWRLATLLVPVAAHFPGLPIEVVSGYRHHNKHHSKSKHTRGRALDFRVEGIDRRVLFELVRHSFDGVGVGYYPNSTFIHLDVRDRNTIWVDYSGPGKTPCYSRTPHQDLADGTAQRLSDSQARAAGCRPP